MLLLRLRSCKRKIIIGISAVACAAVIFFGNIFFGCRFVPVPPLAARTIPSVPAGIAGYARPEESTYLTYPEWHIVYSSAEYARFLKDGRPSAFPYMASVGQFWSSYCTVYNLTNRQYGFNMGDHFMLWVIGTSFSVENAIKSAYEHTAGALSEYAASYGKTTEDDFAYEANVRYVAFINDYPWYEFSFAHELRGLWESVPWYGPHMARKWERRAALTAEWSIKAVYGGFIKLGTRAVYVPAPTDIYARVVDGAGTRVVLLPRYRLFTEAVMRMAREGARFADIAGNGQIFVTAIVPRGWDRVPDGATELFSMDILIDAASKRIGMEIIVPKLSDALLDIERNGARVEHIYDY